VVGLGEHHLDKNDLAKEPKQLGDDPEDEIRLERHVADERVAKEQRIRRAIFAEAIHLWFRIGSYPPTAW
jgi:hypothetical protein